MKDVRILFKLLINLELWLRKIGNELIEDGRQILNIMKNIHLTRTSVG